LLFLDANLVGNISMVLIREVVKQAMNAGYLTRESENQMREIFATTKCDLEDLDAFMSLQLAARAGRVKQESLESINSTELYEIN
jgi:hypothetical protein